MQDRWTDVQVITQLSSGLRWLGNVITFAFPTSARTMYDASGESAGFVPLNSTQADSAILALFTWDDLIRPDLVLSEPGSASNIEFGYTDTAIEYAHAYLPMIGSVWFSSDYASLRNPVPGKSGFDTYVHEIGHALGLNHMGDYNGSDSQGPSSWQDSSLYTVMSYYGPGNSLDGEGQVAWADWVGSDGIQYVPQTPMVNDVMAIQSLYGSGEARSDDTTYGFDANISGLGARLYNFANNTNPILCIYDSAGVDTLNFSGWSSDSLVDLRSGPDSFSSCNDMTSNIQIARGVMIENGVTGAGNDRLNGNEVANSLQGGAGNDTFSGGAGDDTLIGGLGNDSIMLAGTRNDYVVDYLLGASGATTTYAIYDKRGIEGIDSLGGIEWAQFSDARIELSTLASSEVYRFFNTVNGVHFYTGSAIEAENVKNTLPTYSFEGSAFQKNDGAGADAINVYRFYNTVQGAHFYTANAEEVAQIRATLSGFAYEGVAYQAHSQLSGDTTPLYRFYNTVTGTHFYTASEAEKSQVLLTLAGVMNYEGVAFYVDP